MTAKIGDPARLLPWREWYGLWRWKKRKAHQLHERPLCAACLAKGRVTPATIADHEPAHDGNWNVFCLGPLQSLCAVCHERKHGRLGFTEGVSRAVDDDGFPVDPRHPFNQRRPTHG